MLHTYFYQTVVFEKYKTTYRHAVTGLPHIPDSVFDAGAPKAGWDVIDVRYDLIKGELHVVLENRVIQGAGEPQDIDMTMQNMGWQRAPRDPRFCVEVEYKLDSLPSATFKKRR